MDFDHISNSEDILHYCDKVIADGTYSESFYFDRLKECKDDAAKFDICLSVIGTLGSFVSELDAKFFDLILDYSKLSKKHEIRASKFFRGTLPAVDDVGIYDRAFDLIRNHPSSQKYDYYYILYDLVIKILKSDSLSAYLEFEKIRSLMCANEEVSTELGLFEVSERLLHQHFVFSGLCSSVLLDRIARKVYPVTISSLRKGHLGIVYNWDLFYIWENNQVVEMRVYKINYNRHAMQKPG